MTYMFWSNKILRDLKLRLIWKNIPYYTAHTIFGKKKSDNVIQNIVLHAKS